MIKTVIGLIAGLFALALFAAVGAISFGVTGIILAGGAYLLGFVTQGTAQAILIWVAGIGALWGVVIGLGNIAAWAGDP